MTHTTMTEAEAVQVARAAELGKSAALDRLIEAQALRILAEIDQGGLAEIKRLIVHAHRLEIAKIDEESNELAAAIEEIAKGMSEEQAKRLLALAAKLNAMGKPAAPPPNTP